MAQFKPTLDDRTESISYWFEEHVREVSIIAVVLIVLVGGIFGYRRMSAATERNAEQAFFAAQQLRQTGDAARAEAELSKVTTQYRGTAGGTQAGMVVAQLRYDAGKYAEGLQALEQLKDGGVDAEFEASVEALIAAGYEGQGKFAEAAAAYLRAAEEARFAADRVSYQADAARVLGAEGKVAEAVKLWQAIADDPSSPLADEARVRLGELTVEPAGRS